MVVTVNQRRGSIGTLLAPLICLLVMAAAFADPSREARMRDTLLDEIALDYRETATWTGLRAMSPAVREALRRVPREAFVREGDTPWAYVNRPLSIGHGQTISQPFIVALMSDLLEVAPGDRVLEIGTGSGYQAAVLAELGARVWTIEIVAALAASARERLARLGYESVTVRAGDGNLGWPEEAPFDGIIVTAAGAVPPALIEQLAPGGRLVIPVGSTGGDQQLTVITRKEGGSLEQEAKLPVRFVPLTGETARE
ncbi:MAG TPA: protein-L-isoaspartate(D-aspartate) O-methyltransferase [Gammaproteobacteria bacterium]|nr:protein-L-isoaspartate(D-aspartate) O-methyltransferase [Gammaproteobacteria bacterium]